MRREATLLFPVALLAVLPGAALRFLVPAAPRGQLPPPGAWMLWIPIAAMIVIVANLAIARLALRPGTSVGEALGLGLRRMPAMFAAGLIVGAAAVLLLTILATVLVLATGTPGAPPSPRAVASTILITLPLGLYLGARLFMTTPVAAAETGGPIAILRRSWALTRAHAWKLVGLFLLAVILIIVLYLAVSAVVGILIVLIAGPPRPGTLSAMLILLVATVLNMVVTAYFGTMAARIYAQLAGDGASGI